MPTLRFITLSHAALPLYFPSHHTILLCFSSAPYISPQFSFSDRNSPHLRYLSSTLPLGQPIPGLSLSYAHSRSTRAIQSVLYLFSVHTACPFPRPFLRLIPFFLTSPAMLTRTCYVPFYVYALHTPHPCGTSSILSFCSTPQGFYDRCAWFALVAQAYFLI
jgi:hypothetical protein